MSEKRTKADKLQRGIIRTEERMEVRSEGTVVQIYPGAKPVSVVADAAPLDQEIRRRAYELYELRGRQDGHDLDDWLQAEAEIAHMKRAA